MKMICICNNPNCKDYLQEKKIEWDGISSLKLYELTKCPVCGAKRELKDSPEQNENKLTTIVTPTIDSMTPAERKALLKKRSTIDYHKNIEARAREMDKNVIPR